MAKDWDEEQDQEELTFSLEEILAEFGSGGTGEVPDQAPPREEGTEPSPKASPPREKRPPRQRVGEQKSPAQEEGREWREDTIPFPVPPRQEDKPPETGKKAGIVTVFPGKPRQEPERPSPEASAAQEEVEEELPGLDETKVLEFPAPAPENPVAAGLNKLWQKADEFAEHMFEEEGTEDDEAVRRAEELIPGVDVEEDSQPLPIRERKPRRQLPPPPDVPPAELARRYAKGLKGARMRLKLVFFLLVCLCALTLLPFLPVPLPPVWEENWAVGCYGAAGLQGLAMLLGIDGLFAGLIRPFQRRMGMDTMIALANLAVLADAVSLPLLAGEEAGRQPFCAVAVLLLWALLWGNLQKRRGQWMSCRTAASAAEPYRVTRDEGAWNGKDTYAKWPGTPTGFGSQIQALDGAERIYRRVSPILLLACLLFSLISSLGRGRGEDLFWCLAATLSAAAPISAGLCFGRPWQKLSARLAKSGAALAGWAGVVNTTGSSNLLLADTDLFPSGSVSLNGTKVFEGFSREKVVSVTATLIRDAGSGLEKLFYDHLRAEGGVYRRAEQFAAHEAGGVSGVIRGEQVLVGTANFMALMEVPLPPGLNVKNAVFCAIEGELAGIFALNYHLNGAVAPAIDSLIRNHITPVLCTRDFNLIPSMLRQRFKLPADKLEFPGVERRRELSDEEREHSDTLTALLCREGVWPYAEAVIGGKRLRSAVRLMAVLACLGAAVGALLAFYLTFIAAYNSLTPFNLMIFLLVWLVPTYLISNWVDRY